MTTAFTSARIDLLKKLNDEAKNNVKKGEFRQLSQKLVDILKIFDLSAITSIETETETERYEIEREVLRTRVFLWQHLDYWDAFEDKKQINEDLLEGVSAKEIESLKTLFANLNTLRESDIINKEMVFKEGAIAEHEIYVESKKSKETWAGKSISEKNLWQEKVWLCFCYAQGLFRENRLPETIEILERLQQFVFEKLSDEDSFTCYATKATLLSELAKSYRRKGLLREAEIKYYEATQYYLKKTKRFKKIDVDKQSEIEGAEIKYQFRRTAQVYAYGLLQINAAKSDIERCEANLLIADLLLTGQKEDEITLQFVNLSKGVIKRIKAGENKELLEEAEKEVINVKKHLTLLSHRRLISECNWELAIICHLLDKPEEAKNLVNEVWEYYKNDDHYEAKANILLSYIERKNGQLKNALELAELACEFAEKSKNRIARIDARIALAEAAFSLNKHNVMTKDIDAYKLYEKSLELNKRVDNKKINAICYLGLCKVAAFRNDKTLAEQMWQKYEDIKESIQHKFVVDTLARQALEQREILEDNFVIRSKDKDYDYEKQLLKMKKWLYEKAAKPNQSKADLAKILGVSRQTIHDWEKKFK